MDISARHAVAGREHLPSELFSKLSLHRLLSFFRAESHANKLTREDFERLCPQLFGVSQKEGHRFATRMFGALDKDKSGKVDWLEFGTALGALCHGSPGERVEIAFGMADKNSDGLISKTELASFLRMITTQGRSSREQQVGPSPLSCPLGSPARPCCSSPYPQAIPCERRSQGLSCLFSTLYFDR
jgi:Ca2+-binding EF-hand superfamily protein